MLSVNPISIHFIRIWAQLTRTHLYSNKSLFYILWCDISSDLLLLLLLNSIGVMNEVSAAALIILVYFRCFVAKCVCAWCVSSKSWRHAYHLSNINLIPLGVFYTCLDGLWHNNCIFLKSMNNLYGSYISKIYEYFTRFSNLDCNLHT